MKTLTQAWSEIKQGENIDLYLMVGAAFLVGAISLFGVTSSTLTTSVTLALLGLLAIATLKNRHEWGHAIDELIDHQRSARAEDFFVDERDAIEQHLMEADEIFLLGMTLGRTTREHMHSLGQRLVSGAHIRIVILDPEIDALLNQLSLRSTGNTTVEYWRSRLQTVQMVIHVISETPNATGELEVGYLPYIPSFGFAVFDLEGENGNCYIELYHHESAKPNPMFRLSATKDGDWYRFFREQAEILWASCRVETIHKASPPK